MKHRICISIDEAVLLEVDVQASRCAMSRSAFIESHVRSGINMLEPQDIPPAPVGDAPPVDVQS